MMNKVPLLQICHFICILFIYIFLYFFKNDLLLISVLVFSFFWGFIIFRKSNKNYLLNDSSGIFLIFLFLYGFLNPIVEFSLEGILSSSTYLATVIYAICLPSYIIGFSLFKSKGYENLYNKVFLNYSKTSFVIYNKILLVILFILLFYFSYDFYTNGILFNPSVALKINRLELFTEISQLKIIIGFLTTSVFLYFIYYYKLLSTRSKLFVFLLFIYFVTMQLSVGNRKEFVPIIVGIFWVFVNTNKIRFTLRRFFYMIFGIFLFLFLGSIRSNASSEGGFSISNLAILTLSNNEFVFPFYTLTHAVSKYLDGNLNLFFGSTIFFYPFLYFIPRYFFPDKPFSLAVQFVTDIDSSMGYAYLPVTEFFVNFGILGPFVGFLIIGIVISKIQAFKDQRFIFIFFTMIPDFCRGELGLFIYQFIFVSFFIIIIPVILKYNSKV